MTRGGPVLCGGGCRYDTSNCRYFSCGDGQITGNEECEGSNLNGKSCTSPGLDFDGGTLSCNTASCSFNTTGCHKCNNGLAEGPEECDGSDFAQTCLSKGYDGGSERCTSTCTLDLTTCIREAVLISKRGSTQSNGNSLWASISHEGRYVSFTSYATNLSASSDTNGFADVFVFDRNRNLLQRVPPTPQGDGISYSPSVATLGTSYYVAFTSGANNLVNTDKVPLDILGFDGLSQIIRLLNFKPDITQEAGGKDSFAPTLAHGAGFLGYASKSFTRNATTWIDVFWYERSTGRTVLVSKRYNEIGRYGGKGNSSSAAISPDGQFLAFHSAADNLVQSDSNSKTDVFLWQYDQAAVANQTDDFRYNRSLTRVMGLSNQEADDHVMSPSLADQGAFITFTSTATNLTNSPRNPVRNIFLWSKATGTSQLISQSACGPATDHTWGPSVSADGRYVAYYSAAANLACVGSLSGNDQVFVYDRVRDQTVPVSRSKTGQPGNQDSSSPHISGDGRFIVFSSDATNLVSGDTNNSEDIFVVENPLYP